MQTWTSIPQKRQDGSAFALTYILRLSSCNDIGAFVISPLPYVLVEESCAAGPLCSTGVTPLQRSYPPSRHRLVFGRFPGVSGYTTYLAPAISRRDEDGFSSCLACPCHRAASNTPPESAAVSASLRRPILPSPKLRGLGLRILNVTGPPVSSLALRPGDSLTTPKVAWSISFRLFVSSLPVIQATGLWLLPRRGCLPLNTPALAGRTQFVGSRTGAVASGRGSCCCRRLSPSRRCLSPDHRSVSSPLLIARSMRISRTTRPCTLLIKGYGTYPAGAAFGGGLGRLTRYSAKRPSSPYSHPVLHRFQPKPERLRAF